MKPTRITIHCSDTKNGEALPIEVLRKWHTDPPPQGNGWRDVGYHTVIQPDGQLDRGRGFNEIGAHVAGANAGNIGICLIGKDRFTRRQFDVLRRHLNDLCTLYFLRPWAIHTHAQFESAITQGKTCPNMEVNRLLAWYIGNYEEAVWPYILSEPTV